MSAARRLVACLAPLLLHAAQALAQQEADTAAVADTLADSASAADTTISRRAARGSFRGAGVTIYFEPGAATLSPEARALLARFADRLRGDEALAAMITGHTDRCGRPAANARLRERRARAAQRYLIDSLGVGPERLVLAGAGASREVGGGRGGTTCSAARDRRVEARVTPGDGTPPDRPEP